MDLDFAGIWQILTVSYTTKHLPEISGRFLQDTPFSARFLQDTHFSVRFLQDNHLSTRLLQYKHFCDCVILQDNYFVRLLENNHFEKKLSPGTPSKLILLWDFSGKIDLLQLYSIEA